jgi:pimeloyl-ACP methyl ester carboxylesterase
VERYDPDLWTDEFALLSQPARQTFKATSSMATAQTSRPIRKWQAWMREKQPRLLVIGGRHDLSFELSEPEAYRRDVPNAQVHILDGGHFALDTAADKIADLVRGFVGSSRLVPAGRAS